MIEPDEIPIGELNPSRETIKGWIKAQREYHEMIREKDKGMNAAKPEREKCEGCGQEIDPDTCGCGDPMEGHSTLSGHSAIPMGCDCGRHLDHE